MRRGNRLAKAAFCFTYVMGWAVVVVQMITSQWKPDATTLGFFAILAGLSLFPFTRSGKAGLLEWKRDDKNDIVKVLSELARSYNMLIASLDMPAKDRKKIIDATQDQLSAVFDKIMDIVED